MSAPSLDALWPRIAGWSRATFTTSTAASTARHLAREAGELERAAEAYAERPTLDRRHHAAEEAADVLHLLVQAVDRLGLTPAQFAEAVAAKLAVNQGRQWQAPDAAGVVEHVRGVGE